MFYFYGGGYFCGMVVEIDLIFFICKVFVNYLFIYYILLVDYWLVLVGFWLLFLFDVIFVYYYFVKIEGIVE